MPDQAAPVAVHNNTEKSRFEATVEGHLAKAEYRLEPGVLVITHTVVPPELEGRGIGGALVKTALAHARSHGLKVKPECSYARAYMERHPETQDLLA
jgi:predicted GNAT family acetyltransferase